MIRAELATAAVLAAAVGGSAAPAAAAPMAARAAPVASRAVRVVARAARLAPHSTPGGVALARAVLVRRGDFGHGWREQSPPPTAVPGLTCPAFAPRPARAAQTGAAASPTFEAGSSGPFASESAHAYATAGEQGTVWRALVRPGLVRCAAASLRHGGGDGVIFTVTGERTLGLPALRAPAAGYRVRGTASLSYQTVDVYLDMFVIGGGTTIAEVVLSSFEQPPARGLELRLLRTVARRVSAK